MQWREARYDAAGNLIQITYPDSTQVTYAYDAANRLATVTNWLNDAAAYTYDAAGRLTGMISQVSSYQFTLDGNGNRIHSTESEPLTPVFSLGSTIYDYNQKWNRLLSAGDLSYAYDDEGQLVSAGDTTLTFDYNHRLVAIGGDIQFSYDVRGNRLRALRSGVETRYIYDPFGNLLAEADASNQITRKYIYSKGLLAHATPDARYCFHFNATGSTAALTDMS